VKVAAVMRLSARRLVVGAEPLRPLHLRPAVHAVDAGANRFAGPRNDRGEGVGAAGDVHHRFHDLRVAGAAAQHAAERVLDGRPA